MSSPAYRHIACFLCGEPVSSPLDLVVYNVESGAIAQLEFRHQRSCDDRLFAYSHRVRDGFADLLDAWTASPHKLTPQS
jgi:hypothetical protein